jgi:short-subunit dehydrogenase
MTALITGASSGIGLELAKVFAKNNIDLVLVARSTGKLNELATELGNVKVTVLSKDLSLATASKEVFEEIKAKNIQIDYLVNNAGFGDFGFFHESDWNKNAQMIDLNIKSLTELTYLFGKEMVARKSGKIMNVASTASFQPGPLMGVYYATKHYVLAFSEAIDNEMSEHGVSVTALCPGPTESGFQNVADLDESKLVKGKKLPTSKEVAEYGYKAMMNGKTVAIHGTMNYILANSVRFTPRNVIVKIVRWMSEKA